MRISRPGAKTGSVAAAATLFASVGLVAIAAPASAALTTTCVGVAENASVPGNLVVPANQSCDLTNVSVGGNVTVRAGADLVADGGSFAGNVTVIEDAYFDAINTSVDGRVLARSAFGAYLESSSVGANLQATTGASGEGEGFLFAIDTDVSGNFTATNGDLFAEDAAISGNAVARDVAYADFFGSYVDGNLLVENAEFGSIFVDGEVYGNATYRGNSSVLQLGADGPSATAEAMSYWGGNVTVVDNTADVYIDNNIVRGNLRALRNDPVAQVGENNRVRGSIVGDVAPIAEARTMARMAPAQVDRKAEVEAKVEERKSAAVADAAEAGDAKL